MNTNISKIAKFCEHAQFAIDNYPGHVNYEYDDLKIKIFLHYNFNCICPFDVIEEIEIV